ncbi:hypothetical protein [Halolactibacillus alkaliphilus]|uniref:hypothetical protein n=1 Tax=Halolactibacillus alkaliphilus TaxID=442899 RepID=UPI0008DF36CB|nr:hypothetical protein [Halolactibacillus alkaliphilus]SFO84835.1 hypothetical protein SAMN05720591_11620 [Halolactibacillus alkaliphilus]
MTFSFVNIFVPLEGKTSGQKAKIIEAEVIALVDYAVKQHKPLAIERLDTTAVQSVASLWKQESQSENGCICLSKDDPSDQVKNRKNGGCCLRC